LSVNFKINVVTLQIKIMKANELRINNWVYNRTTKKEMQVYPMMIPQLAQINDENNIEPIPITQEWIIKFNAEKIKGYGNNRFWYVIFLDEYKDESMLFIHYSIGDNFCTLNEGYNETIIKKIKYVHELQNLYFALTGEEL